MNSNIEFRRATARDADAIAEIAQQFCRKARINAGASAEMLSVSGFILFPLAARSSTEPNYAERIRILSRFNVAAERESGRVLAYAMAGTLGEMDKLPHPTPNDKNVIAFYTEPHADKDRSRLVLDPETVFIDQVVRHPDVTKNYRISDGLLASVLSTHGSLKAIADVPHGNNAARKFFLRNAFARLADRVKDPGTEHERTVDMFIRTVDAKYVPPHAGDSPVHGANG